MLYDAMNISVVVTIFFILKGFPKLTFWYSENCFLLLTLSNTKGYGYTSWNNKDNFKAFYRYERRRNP